MTVRELLARFERVTGRLIPKIEAPARPGDPIGAFANVDRAQRVLGWSTGLTLDDAIRDAIAFAAVREDVLSKANLR